MTIFLKFGPCRETQVKYNSITSALIIKLFINGPSNVVANSGVACICNQIIEVEWRLFGSFTGKEEGGLP